jgi:hypothetical protein
MNQIEQLSKDWEGNEERYEINSMEIDDYDNPIRTAYTIKDS